MLTQDVNQQMLSSLALFKGILLSHNGDVWSIVRDFIIATVKRANLTSFDVKDLREALNKEFNIDIENAVIKKVLEQLSLIDFDRNISKYVVTQELVSVDNRSFNEELSIKLTQCEKLLGKLYDFFQTEQESFLLDEKNKILIRDYFFRYIIDKENVNKDNEFVVLINRFVLQIEKDSYYQSLFCDIRQGLIILEGLNFSRMTNDKTWKYETTFFLDTHYLFSFFGLNSEYHKANVDDFFNLVNQINKGASRKNGAKKRITLTYFPETRQVIDKFFTTAFRIKMGDENLKPYNEAMVKIDSLCPEAEDVSILKNRFLKALRDAGINEYPEKINLLEGKDYLYEKDELSKLVADSFSEEDRDEVLDLFRFADYVNILRQGKTVTNLEQCSYIFLTDKNLSLQVSKFLHKNDQMARTHVFEKMEWFTQRMWYLTCQSFTFDKSLTSFDLAIKAKMVLSGICKDNIASIYEELKKKGANTDESLSIYDEMRNYQWSADKINNDNAQSTVKQFSNGALEQFHVSYQQLVDRAKYADHVETENAKLKESISSISSKIDALNHQMNAMETENRNKRSTLYKYIGILIVVIIILAFWIAYVYIKP